MSRDAVLLTGLLLGGAGYLALAWYVWRHRGAAGGRALLGVLLAVFAWSTFYALEVGSRTVARAEFWSALKYTGVVGMPPCLLAYAVAHTGRRGLRRRWLALLSVVPVLTLVSLAVPATKGLIHVYPDALRAAGQLEAAPVPDAGPLFWPHAAYNYALAFFALGLAVVRLSRAGRAHRTQAVLVAVASLVPLGANIAYNLGFFGPDAEDPVPFLFALLAVVLVWGFFRSELLDVLPVARDVVLEQMADGVVVLDVHDRIVDANPAAAEVLGLPPAGLVGRALTDLIPGAARLLDRAGKGHHLSAPDLSIPARGELPARDLAVTLTPLVVRGEPAGHVVLLHDVSERETARRRLRELLDEQTRLAETLEASLRPQDLPGVPGLQLAARSMPAGEAGQLSGDFFDVHRVGGGDWAVAVGDVSGKGVEAAVVTAMARYTVRTLSAEGHTPGQVLEQLNRALIVDESSGRFCTLAYARIDGADLLGLAGAGGIEGSVGRGGVEVKVTLALGGHPCPLLRRHDGPVEPVGQPGTVLGLLPGAESTEVELRLSSGDVLLFYTDGVTEARRGSEQFGEGRLVEVLSAAAAGLRGRTGETAAHLVAEAVADRVLAEVTTWASRRDDVAVLVLVVP